MRFGQNMNNRRRIEMLAIVLCGSASCRPTQAFFSSHSSFTLALQTADWEPATTKLTLNDQQVVDQPEQLSSEWINCDTLQPQAIELLESGYCVRRNFSFEANQERSLSFLYQLVYSERLKSINEPLVRFLWNGAEVAWLSQATEHSQWLTIGIPGSDKTGLLTIKLTAEDSDENAIQFRIDDSTSSRLLLRISDNLILSTDDPTATIYVSRDASPQPLSALGHLTIPVQELNDSSSITYWSVDDWGNTESPKLIMLQVIHEQASKPKVLWQAVQNNRLYLVVQTEPTRTVELIGGYELIADFAVTGTLEQPSITTSQALHEPGTLVGLSFPLSSGIHAARLHSINQVGIISPGSDVIIF